MSFPPLSRLLALPASVRGLVLKPCSASPAHRPLSSIPCRYLSATPLQSHAEPEASPPPRESSVNHAEVSHFNALASSWWDPHGSSRLLHLMNPLRHAFIRRCFASSADLSAIPTKLRYLDVGCGGGIFAESAARLPTTQSVTAIDPSPDVVAVARQHQRQDPLLLEPGRLTYKNTAIEDLTPPASPEGGYDILTLFEVIEHIRQPSPFLQECLKHIKPGGWLIGSTIARTNTSWFTTKLVAEEVLRLVPKGTHDWDQYIQPHELRNWARARPELDAEGDGWKVMGVVYVPGLGWREVTGSDAWGNYFFGMRRSELG